MKVKGIFGILAIAAAVGIFVFWIASDYSKHWLPLEIAAYACGAVFLGAIAWVFFNTNGKDKPQN